MGTITKALEMLNFFSRDRPDIGLGEFVRLSGRDKATVHRHLVELEKNGFLEQHSETRAYRLGPAILRLSGVREASYPMRKLLRPITEALAQEVGELAHVSMLQGTMLSPIVHADPGIRGTQVHFSEAEMLPLHATSSGVAVLAFAPAALIKRVLSKPLKSYTRHTVVDPLVIDRMLTDIRRTGLSRLDRGFDEEVSSQAAPLFDGSGTAIGAISVAVPSARSTPDRERVIAAALQDAARSATHSLGGAFPDVRAEPPPSEISR